MVSGLGPHIDGHNPEAGPTRPPKQSSSHVTQQHQVKLTTAVSPPAPPPSCQLEPRERSTLSKERSCNVSTAEWQRGSRAERVRPTSHLKSHERLQALGDQQSLHLAVSSMKLNKPQREAYDTQGENGPVPVSSSLQIRDSTHEIRLSSYRLQIHQSSTQCPLRPKTQLSFLHNSPPCHPAKPPEKRKWGLRKDK